MNPRMPLSVCPSASGALSFTSPYCLSLSISSSSVRNASSTTYFTFWKSLSQEASLHPSSENIPVVINRKDSLEILQVSFTGKSLLDVTSSQAVLKVKSAILSSFWGLWYICSESQNISFCFILNVSSSL